MTRMLRFLTQLGAFTALLGLGFTSRLAAQAGDDPLAAWRTGVKIQQVSPEPARHTVHSYFNTCPESPDGSKVLFYTSTTPDAHTGEVWVRDRKTGEEKRIATNLKVEDAHRVACQQWVRNGKAITYHAERDGRWFVATANVD
ncbi:MAG: TolB family protein, partial [Verrucomicrobium sp.]